MTVFHENLNRFVAERGWKTAHLLSALSDMGIEVSFDAVKRWLSGENEPRSTEVLAAIARVLDTTPNALLGFESPQDAGEHGVDALDAAHGETVSGAKA